MVFTPVAIGIGLPTWYHVNIGLTTAPFGVYRYELFVVVQAVEFLPGTVTAVVPG